MNISDRSLNALQGKTFACQQSDNSALLYSVNWAAVLQADTISASTWSTESSGVTIASAAVSGNVASARLSGEPGKHTITNKITTAAGDVDERSISLTISGIVALGDYD